MKPNCLTLPLAVLALLVIAAPAQARHKPTNRARIHSLEKKVADLQTDVAELLDRVANLEQDSTRTRGLLRQCFFGFPVQSNMVATSPTGDPVPVFGINFATPSVWLAAINPGCLSSGFVAAAAR